MIINCVFCDAEVVNPINDRACMNCIEKLIDFGVTSGMMFDREASQ